MTKVNKYILIDTRQQASYSYIGYGYLTEKEANIKNRAFNINKANKKYILKKDWK